VSRKNTPISQKSQDKNLMITKKTLFSWIFHRYVALQLLLFILIVIMVFARVFPLEMQKRIVNIAIRFQNLHSLYLYCGLFGHLKMEHPSAAERVQENVVRLLADENLLDEILDIGLQFNVGSSGDRLSGGQKQKVALARALLKNPSILILDEATAGLDNASQARVQHILESECRGRCTVIAVAHRLDTIRGFDRIAVMKAGRIIEMGSYGDLMARKGVFYELAHGS
jgi:ABC-type methionine transport system ATPase subunit